MRVFYIALLFMAVACTSVPSFEQESDLIINNIITDAMEVKEVINVPIAPRFRLDTLKLLAKEALIYNRINDLDTTQCILIDMYRHPGTKRLFLWDFKKDSVVKSALVSHGYCDEWNENWRPIFKNTHESHCSSLGKYKTGDRVWSSFGVGFSYKLHGLESTNSNAYDRVIVFHSWELTPDEEVYPEELVNSWGCPAVSDNFMLEIDKDIKKLKQPILLWIFN